ncbi:MAG: hypothetical protein J6P16_00610 [Eubacterium sp.]|nr:hypothetical protein [Eubacterium sp.]
MFGYVVVNKPELKIREFTDYNAYYCGLCHMLRHKYGISAGFTLTYDMTFLIMLLGSLYEPKLEVKKRHCPIHPVAKKPMIRSDVTEYAADMNILLSWAHLHDDWEDEKKIAGLIGDTCFRRRAEHVIKKYPRQAEVVRTSLESLSGLEKHFLKTWDESRIKPPLIKSMIKKHEADARRYEWMQKIGGTESYAEVDLDEISAPFGALMGELFVWKDDAFAPILRRFGFLLGKYIYIRDALDDIEKDRKNASFNPFLHVDINDDFNRDIKKELDVIIKNAIAEFEKLPLERNITILRNILYEGVRTEKSKTTRHPE